MMCLSGEELFQLCTQLRYFTAPLDEKIPLGGLLVDVYGAWLSIEGTFGPERIVELWNYLGKHLQDAQKLPGPLERTRARWRRLPQRHPETPTQNHFRSVIGHFVIERKTGSPSRETVDALEEILRLSGANADEVDSVLRNMCCWKNISEHISKILLQIAHPTGGGMSNAWLYALLRSSDNSCNFAWLLRSIVQGNSRCLRSVYDLATFLSERYEDGLSWDKLVRAMAWREYPVDLELSSLVLPVEPSKEESRSTTQEEKIHGIPLLKFVAAWARLGSHSEECHQLTEWLKKLMDELMLSNEAVKAFATKELPLSLSAKEDNLSPSAFVREANVRAATFCNFMPLYRFEITDERARVLRRGEIINVGKDFCLIDWLVHNDRLSAFVKARSRFPFLPGSGGAESATLATSRVSASLIYMLRKEKDNCAMRWMPSLRLWSPFWKRIHKWIDARLPGGDWGEVPLIVAPPSKGELLYNAKWRLLEIPPVRRRRVEAVEQEQASRISMDQGVLREWSASRLFLAVSEALVCPRVGDVRSSDRHAVSPQADKAFNEIPHDKKELVRSNGAMREWERRIAVHQGSALTAVWTGSLLTELDAFWRDAEGGVPELASIVRRARSREYNLRKKPDQAWCDNELNGESTTPDERHDGLLLLVEALVASGQLCLIDRESMYNVADYCLQEKEAAEESTAIDTVEDLVDVLYCALSSCPSVETEGVRLSELELQQRIVEVFGKRFEL